MPLSLFFTPIAAIQPPASRPQHPWWHAAAIKSSNQTLKHEGSERFSHGDRQGNQGDGASAARQGGHPVGTSHGSRAGRDLRRQQTPPHRFAPLYRPEAEDT